MPRLREEQTAAPLVPRARNLEALRSAASWCRACELGEPATQTVFGEGASRAKLCLVGEQPGDAEDLAGKPFVGPAGRLLDRALGEAGVARSALYVTNAVKHFGYRPMGNKKRLHQKPPYHCVVACRPWLIAEFESLRPEVILCMGATAAQSLMGPRFSIMRNFGEVLETPWAKLLVTYHPSALLRMPRGEPRDAAYAQFVAALRHAAELSGAQVD
jgi:uracil-DNA glycosylase